MGKIIKNAHGKPSVFQFNDKKQVRLDVDETEVHLVELGMMDTEVGEVGVKEISLYDAVIELLKKCNTLQEVKWGIKKLQAVGGTSESSAEPQKQAVELIPREGKLKHWEDFTKLVNAFYTVPAQVPDILFEEAKTAVKEAICAFVDTKNHNHEDVKKYMIEILVFEALRDDKDRLWVLKDIFMKLSGLKEAQNEDELGSDYRQYIQGLQAQLGPHFYRPVDYPNDTDYAEELLAAAETYMDMGKLEDALSTVEQAISVATNYLQSYYRLAEYYLKNQDFHSAAGALERIEGMPMADKILGSRKEFYLVLSKLCKKIEDKTLAVQHEQKLKSLASKYQISIDELAA